MTYRLWGGFLSFQVNQSLCRSRYLPGITVTGNTMSYRHHKDADPPHFTFPVTRTSSRQDAYYPVPQHSYNGTCTKVRLWLYEIFIIF